MVKKYGIKGFRKYNEMTSVELNRINIFIGENNIGKSSFIRTIPMLRQTIETESDQLEWYGHLVDLGNNKSNFSILIKFDESKRYSLRSIRLRIGPIGRAFEDLLEDYLDEILNRDIRFEFRNGQISEITCKGYGSFMLNRDELKFIDLENNSIDLRVHGNAFVSMRGNKGLFGENLLNRRVQQLREVDEKTRKVTLQYIIVVNLMKQFFSNSKYISGNRVYGERFQRVVKKRENQVSANGDNIVQLVNSMNSIELKELNDKIEKQFGFTISKVKKDAPLAELKLKIKKKEYNIIDLGSGYAQILPIIIELNSKRRGYIDESIMIVIEQPEIHLHPGLVKKLVSIMYKLCENSTNIQFIIETHSSDVIYQLCNEEYRYRSEEKSTGMVKIFNVEEDSEENNTIQSYEIIEEGIINWPRNFLT